MILIKVSKINKTLNEDSGRILSGQETGIQDCSDTILGLSYGEGFGWIKGFIRITRKSNTQARTIPKVEESVSEEMKK